MRLELIEAPPELAIAPAEATDRQLLLTIYAEVCQTRRELCELDRTLTTQIKTLQAEILLKNA